MSPTAQGHRNAAGRLLLTTLLLFAFVGGARANDGSHWSEPDYNVNPFSNTVIAAIQINGEYITQDGNWADLEVAAFVDGECRGHAFMEYSEEYGDLYPIVEMNIYYNNSNDEVSFKMYDHSTEVMYEDCEVLYQGEQIRILTGYDHIEGRYDPENPIILNFTTQPTTLTQTIQLAAGWNWVSFYVEITLDDLKTALFEALPEPNITINSQSGSTTYNGSRWRGQLHSLDLTQMYQIKVVADCEIMLEGMPIDPAEHPATINNGDNWMAFPLSETMSVNEAFADFPASGDMVISQTASAVFTDLSWRGELTTLEPGQGYIYYSASENISFTFPEVQSEAGGNDNNVLYETYWPDFDYHAFQFNRPFVAAIMIDGEIITHDRENWDALEVAAFVDDECRANEMSLTDEYVLEWGEPFPMLNGLPIYYSTPDEPVSFKMYDHLNDVFYENCEVLYEGELNFIYTGEDHTEGYCDPENPIILRFTTPTPPPFDDLVLADDDSEKGDEENNTALISVNDNGEEMNVKLDGRTLWKNGHWNTICLPFEVSIEDSEFQNATVMELDTEESEEFEHETGFDGGSLYLNFKEVDTGTMEAGKPYIVKWEDEDDYIENPIFYNVTIQNVDPADGDHAVTSADEKVTFKGIFSAMEIDGEDKTMLYLSKDEEDEEVKLFYPNGEMTIGAFRAYFQLNGIEAGDVSEARLYFAGSEASGIKDVQRSTMNVQREDAWFTLDGLKRQGKPTGKGLYIHGNRKVVIK